MALELLAFLIYGVVVIALFVIYIYTLVRQAKKKQWLWFVFTLLMSPVLIIYWIVKLVGGVK